MGALAFSFATPADVAEVVPLVESAYRGEASRAGWTTEADLLGGQRTDAAMVEATMTRPGAHVLLARDAAGTLVACCELHEPAGRGRADDGRAAQAGAAGTSGGAAEPAKHGCTPDAVTSGAAYFGMFAVAPSLQGAGVGRGMLAEAERIARDNWGAATLEMTVIRQRTELIGWYERRGYRRTGESKPFPYGDERFGQPTRGDLALAVLEKRLGATPE